MQLLHSNLFIYYLDSDSSQDRVDLLRHRISLLPRIPSVVDDFSEGYFSYTSSIVYHSHNGAQQAITQSWKGQCSWSCIQKPACVQHS